MKGASLIAPFGLRMPEELKEKISERAKSNGRSMNAEIVQILEDALDENRVTHLQVKLKEGEAIEIDTNDINSLASGLKALVDNVVATNKKPT